MPHDAAVRVCPTTGLRLNGEPPSRSRMTEHPPPERHPEPLGFESAAEPAKPKKRAPVSESMPGAGPTKAQRELIGVTLGERYRVTGILGEGGMGTVYDAEHLGLGRGVAIKVLNPAQAKKRVAVKRFQQEARAAGAIGHPNICEVYDLGQLEDGSPFLVMEKLVGQTLADRINREGGLPFDDVADVMIQVLSGLIAAHDKGIVHRDIKPENIFLARRVGCPPIAKILDFGVSKMMPAYANGDDNLDLTRTGMVMGTPYYMSPEQARGQRDLDGRVDVYACGVMMYEAVAGKRPFLAPNYNALLLAIINTSPRPLVDLRTATPPDLDAVVRRAMARQRDDRYVSAMQMMRDLQALELGRSGGRAGRGTGRSPALFATREGDLGRPAPRVVDVVADAPPAQPAPSPPGPRGYPQPLPSEPPGAAAGLLARSMSEGRIPVVPESEPQTRIDLPARRTGSSRVASPLAAASARPASDSIEIPIEIGEEADASVQNAPVARPALAARPAPPAASHGRAAEFDDVPTEVFRPGKHLPAARPPAAHAASPSHLQRPPTGPMNVPGNVRAQPRPAPSAPPPPPPTRNMPSAPPPPPTRNMPNAPPPPAHPGGAYAHASPASPPPQPNQPSQQARRPSSPPRQPAAFLAPANAPPIAPPPPIPTFQRAPLPEDWEGETVVRRPQDLMSAKAAAAVAAAASASKKNGGRPFNPDETMKLDSMEIEVEFGEDTRTPRKR
jgi:serine/threonine-protein kinase